MFVAYGALLSTECGNLSDILDDPLDKKCRLRFCNMLERRTYHEGEMLNEMGAELEKDDCAAFIVIDGCVSVKVEDSTFRGVNCADIKKHEVGPVIFIASAIRSKH